MKGSIRNQILYYLYNSKDSDKILFERFRLPIDIFFRLLKAIKNQGLIRFDESKIPNKVESYFIYPDINIVVELTDLGVKYVKRNLIYPKEKDDFNPDKLDSFQFENVGVNIATFENMSYSDFVENHIDLPRNLYMDKNIFYYILTGNFIDKENIKEQPKIKETLLWLKPFPIAFKSFNEALNQYQNNDYSRTLLDNLRFSLEQFLKIFFANNAPIEKQTVGVKTYLKQQNISNEIISIYIDVFQRFYQYQNEKVKHNEKYSDVEIEFIIELTTSLMRLLLKNKA